MNIDSPVDAMLKALVAKNKPIDVVTTTDGYTATFSDVKPEDIKRVDDHLQIGGSSDNYDVEIKISLDIRREVNENGIIYTMTYGDTITSFLLINHY